MKKTHQTLLSIIYQGHKRGLKKLNFGSTHKEKNMSKKKESKQNGNKKKKKKKIQMREISQSYRSYETGVKQWFWEDLGFRRGTSYLKERERARRGKKKSKRFLYIFQGTSYQTMIFSPLLYGALREERRVSKKNSL